MPICDSVCAKIITDQLVSCDFKPVGGLEQEIKLVNSCDISDNIADFTVTTAGVITAFSGTPASLNAVKIQGIPSKRLLYDSFSWANTDYFPLCTHVVNLFGQGLSKESVANLNSFLNGASVVAFVKAIDTGVANDSQYWVYGWKNGLKLADGTFNRNENNGNFVYSLTSLEPSLEPSAPLRLFLTDLPTTQAFFDGL
jgi:hypothetical protein